MNNFSMFKKIILFLVLTTVGMYSCKKDKITNNPDAKLDFSTDTLTFDTVLTQQGSVTYAFKVYNKNDEAVQISRIRLAGGTASAFRLNIDGTATNESRDLVIRGKDSIYIFAEVTINPNSATSPFFIQDSVEFETNGNYQNVKLIAWGQNAYYHGSKNAVTVYKPEIGNDCASGVMVWGNDKAHVIYGIAVIDSACTLQIQEGTKVYVHGNSLLYVYRDGKIQAIGSQINPIYFQQDRLEPMFRDIPGQWGGIWMQEGSVGNILENVEIKNADIGLILGGYLNGLQPLNMPAQASLKNVKIKNSATSAINASDAVINAENCLFHDSGKNLVQLYKGGSHTFTHCTMTNFGRLYLQHQVPSLGLANFVTINDVRYDKNLTANFTNCIIYGTLSDELALQKSPNTAIDFNVQFKNCVIRNQQNYSSYFTNVLRNQDPLFENYREENYTLKADSPCKDAGTATSINTDILGNTRDALPDIGCYEVQ